MSTFSKGPDRDEPRDWPSTGAGAARTAAVPDFSAFMKQVFPEARGADAGLGAMVPAKPQRAGIMRRDYETALTLLQRASDAFPALVHHCRQLEAELRRVHGEAEDQVRAAHGEIQQWQQIAVAMKLHIEESEHQIATLRARVAAAEERLAAGQSLTTAAEQQANLAIGITTLFHDKIIEAFGVGSAAHATLDAVAQGALRAPEPPVREPH